MTGPTPSPWQPPSMSPPAPPPPPASGGRPGSNATLGIVAAVVAVVLVGVGVWWFTKSDDSSTSSVDVDFTIDLPRTTDGGGNPVVTQPPSSGGGGGFPEEVRQAYLTSCGSSSEGNVSYCECTLRELEARFTFDEFIALEDQFSASGELPAVMTEIADICL